MNKKILITTLTLLMLIFSVTQALATLSDNTSVFLPFNQNTLDSTGKNNASYLIDYSADGVNGYSANLSDSGSTNFFTINDSDSLDCTDAITLNFWIKPRTLTTTNFILDKWYDGANRAYYFWMDNNGDMPFGLSNNAGTSQLESTATLGITTGTWQMVTAKWSTTENKLIFYKNAVNIWNSTTGTSSTLFPNNKNPVVGGTGGASSDALFDNYGIWCRSLSNSEITSLYNAGAGIEYPFSGNTFCQNNPSSAFCDDAETGTITDKWTINDPNYPSNSEYTTLQAYAGSKSIYVDPTNNGVTYVNLTTLALTTGWNISFQVYADTSGWTGGEAMLMFSHDLSDAYTTDIDKIIASGSTPSASWYPVQMIYNGTSFVTTINNGAPDEQNVNGYQLANLVFGNQNGDEVIYVDDFVVNTYVQPLPNEITGCASPYAYSVFNPNTNFTQIVVVSLGNVCRNSTLYDVPPTAGVNCDVYLDCTNGTKNATYYYAGYNNTQCTLNNWVDSGLYFIAPFNGTINKTEVTTLSTCQYSIAPVPIVPPSRYDATDLLNSIIDGFLKVILNIGLLAGILAFALAFGILAYLIVQIKKQAKGK